MEYTYIHKEIEHYPSSSEEMNVMVGGCTLNSLVEHPYKDAFYRFGIPAGLVVSKGSAPPLHMTSLTREMVIKGGFEKAPSMVSDGIYDELFDKISLKKPERKFTRKLRK